MTEPDATPQMCLECGAENAGAAQVCARCGAPLAHQPPAAASMAGEARSSTPLPHELAGRRNRPEARRTALILAGLGFVVLVAVTVLVASVMMIITRSVSSRPSASSARPASSPPSASPPPSRLQLAVDQLKAGDCLTGSGLGLGTDSPWPDSVTAVPCTQQHIAEVFFAGDAWPQSQAYPGDNAINNQGDDRCNTAFVAYDGTASDNSAFSYDFLDPSGADDWASGDRWLVCVAYSPTAQDPGGASVAYSIKGSNH
jgi:Septum formation